MSVRPQVELPVCQALIITEGKITSLANHPAALTVLVIAPVAPGVSDAHKWEGFGARSHLRAPGWRQSRRRRHDPSGGLPDQGRAGQGTESPALRESKRPVASEEWIEYEPACLRARCQRQLRETDRRSV